MESQNDIDPVQLMLRRSNDGLCGAIKLQVFEANKHA